MPYSVKRLSGTLGVSRAAHSAWCGLSHGVQFFKQAKWLCSTKRINTCGCVQRKSLIVADAGITKPWYIILPESKFRVTCDPPRPLFTALNTQDLYGRWRASPGTNSQACRWDLCQVFFILYMAAMVPVRVGFDYSALNGWFWFETLLDMYFCCLLYTSPSPRD